MLRRLGQRRSVQRHDALIALAGRRLVEGDRQIALAEQAEQGRIAADFRQPFGIELGIAAPSTSEDASTRSIAGG
jgi:hypothetical protein